MSTEYRGELLSWNRSFFQKIRPWAGENEVILRSNAFADGKSIPVRFTCEGEDISPPLQWSGPPQGAQSFVLLLDDPDAPSGRWHHWAVYDIPADIRSLPEDFAARENISGIGQAIGDSHRAGYAGPCPPRGHGTHRYQFHLLALSIEHLPVKPRAHCTEVEGAARAHMLDEAILTGLFKRH